MKGSFPSRAKKNHDKLQMKTASDKKNGMYSTLLDLITRLYKRRERIRITNELKENFVLLYNTSLFVTQIMILALILNTLTQNSED